VGLLGLIVTAELPDDATVRKDPADVLRQEREESELERREVNRAFGDRHLTAREIDPEGADLQDGGVRASILLRLPKNQMHASEKVAHLEWLGHIVVSAGIYRINLMRFETASGDDDDWHMRPRADLLRQLDAVEIWKTEIEQNDIGPLAVHDRKCPSGGVRLGHAEAVRIE
jgi:hypothetical protein